MAAATVQKVAHESVKQFEILKKEDTKQIILPKSMTCRQAIECLEKKEREDEHKIAPHHVIPCFPLDGAVNFMRALRDVYGWVEAVPTSGFFGSTPPHMIGVQVDLNETVQVPWGTLCIPGIDGSLTTGMEGEPTPTFVIGGAIRQKHADEVLRIVELTKKYVREKSIYKGKAIRLSYEWIRQRTGFHPISHAPKFMDLNGVKREDLIFSDEVTSALDLGLFTPIEQSAACRLVGTPLKRGVLLEGPFGTGKTLTANVTALLATANDWTFVYLESVEDLARGLAAAAQYAPCVLFAEDLNRVVRGERSIDMDQILNILDGVDTKKLEIITVMTTNDIGSINPAILRPGRIDVAISVKPPDAKAASRLVKLYARGLLSDKADLVRIGNSLSGKIPASIREVVERSKLAAISRLSKQGMAITKVEDLLGKVTETDLIAANAQMEMHCRLLEPKPIDRRSMAEQFGDTMGSKLGEAMASTVASLTSSLVEAMEAGNKGELLELYADVDVETSSPASKG